MYIDKIKRILNAAIAKYYMCSAGSMIRLCVFLMQ